MQTFKHSPMPAPLQALESPLANNGKHGSSDRGGKAKDKTLVGQKLWDSSSWWLPSHASEEMRNKSRSLEITPVWSWGGGLEGVATKASTNFQTSAQDMSAI